MSFEAQALVGTEAGGYLLDRVLVDASDGVLYASRDPRHDRPLAVKVLRCPRPGPRFERVAAVVRDLDSPRLARLFATARLEGGHPAVIVEYVGGRTLLDRLRGGPIGLVEGIRAMEHLLDALHTCHRAGIIHRDLRPRALRLVPRLGRAGNDLKLLDVGIAQMLSDRAAPAMGDVLYGHPLFTAPEQWVNREVDARTDLYAAGLLGLVMFSGDHFIKPGPPLEVCTQHFRAPRPRLVETAGGEPIPAPLANLLVRATDPDREKRFRNVAQMRLALDRARAALPRRPTGPMRHAIASIESLSKVHFGEASLLDGIAAQAASFESTPNDTVENE